jgi:LPXTG-motif cell wall-anchored protein
MKNDKRSKMRKSAAVIVAAVILALSVASSAAAQYPPKVKGNQIQGNEQPQRSEEPLVLPQQTAPDNLPFTGADLTLFVIAGLATVGVGIIVVRRTRRREEV